MSLDYYYIDSSRKLSESFNDSDLGGWYGREAKKHDNEINKIIENSAIIISTLKSKVI